MEKIATVIVDDEIFSCDILKKLIAAYCPEIDIKGEAGDMNSAYDLIIKTKPELVFLDICLINDNGFDLIKKIGAVTFDIIFVSGHSEYALPAFKVNAIDYLLKPVDSEDLITAVKKIKQKKNTEALGSPHHRKATDRAIPIHINNIVKYVNASQITSLIAKGNYTEVNTIDFKKSITSKTLANMENQFQDLPYFLRIHRSVIVNYTHIKSYTKTNPCCINMADGNTFEISRRKKAEMLSLLKNVPNKFF